MTIPTNSGKPKRKSINSAWFTSLISISMVLVLLGGLGFILFNAGRLADYVREKIGFTIVLNENIKEIDLAKFQKTLASSPFVKSLKYIDKETAAKELSTDLGEDFKGFLGYNPLFASIEIKLYAAYTNPEGLKSVEKAMIAYPEVKEVYYQKNLLTLINQNIRKISAALLIVSGLLIFVFVSLINNTIRISIYSQRFTINTMQLVGANHTFIRKPFLINSLLIGLYGALIANVVLISSVFAFEKELEGLISVYDLTLILFVPLSVIVLGIVISWFSTYFAVNKFLKLKFDELFY
jgi:cell division transport system permease protein